MTNVMHWAMAEYTARFAPINDWHHAHGQDERFGPEAFCMQGLSK
jgi:hypothetical protein